MGGASVAAAVSWMPPPGLYAVVPAQTDLVFHLRLLGMFPVSGAFPGASGEMRLDMAHPDAIALSVRVPVAGVRASSRFLGEQLRSARWLDAARFPDMRFVSRRVSFTAPGEALVAGDLTLHGVTRPLTLHAIFREAREAAPHDAADHDAVGHDAAGGHYLVRFAAEGELRRGDFGMRALWAVLDNDVRLTLQATFEKE